MSKRIRTKKIEKTKKVNLEGYYNPKYGKFVGPYKRKAKQYPNHYVTQRIDPKTGQLRWVEVTKTPASGGVHASISMKYLDQKPRGVPEVPISREQARKAFENQPLKSRVIDLQKRAKKVYPADQITSGYLKSPGRKDVEGIDTPPTESKKKKEEAKDKGYTEFNEIFEKIKEINTKLENDLKISPTERAKLEGEKAKLIKQSHEIKKDEIKEVETKEEEIQKDEKKVQDEFKKIDFDKKQENLIDLTTEFQRINDLLYGSEGLDEREIDLLKKRREDLLGQRKILKIGALKSGEKGPSLFKHVNHEKGIYVSEISKDNFIVQFDYNAYNRKGLGFKENWRSCAMWNPVSKEWKVRLGKQKDALKLLKNEGFIDSAPEVSKSLSELYLTEKERKKGTIVIEIDDDLKIGKLEGDPAMLRKINEYYSYYSKGYTFSEKYKAGTWDGKIHIISMENRTLPKNLAYNILDEKDKIDPNLDVKVIDFRRNAIRKDKFDLKEVQLYDYQQEALSKAIEEKQGLIVVATGGGKTEIASGIIAEFGEDNDTIFLVHTTALQDQAEERLEMRLGVDVGLGSDIKNTKKGDVNVVTNQSLYKAYKAKEKGEELTKKQKEILNAYKDAEVVIQDEAHHVKAKTFKKIIDDSETKHLYGLTATPYRDENDEKEVFARFGKQVINIPADLLIEKGRLVPPTIKIISIPPRREAINAGNSAPKKGSERYNAIRLEQVINNTDRNELIRKLAEKQKKSGKVSLVFVDRIDHGELLSKLLDCPFLNGQKLNKTIRTKNKRIIKEVADGKIKTIVATQQLFGEGFDLPAIDSLIIADAGGASRVRTIQRAGRALRTKQGKESCEIYDFNDQIDYLNEHTEERIKTYKEHKKFKLKELSEKELKEELNS